MHNVQTQTQFSIFLVNKPGVLAQVANALAEEKINILAMTLMDSQEHGVLRLVAQDAAATRGVLKQLNLPMTETEVLCVELPNKPGAMAHVAVLLGQDHVNINYAYVTSGAPGGKTTGIFKVGDANKAIRLLKGASSKHREADLHRPGARR